ncbi:hypothetical protein JNUCC1_02927 [Lentibacillus sp. JNUCC-1]|uniref:flagellar protein FlgN n=1 Tax=Lentibacillus sp. JNUCC-1 TaxID=2654513 RepID=UPI0012E6FAB9|nr:flagellar protein FlgN [Lentibacillus sp. JNUCC-1]MUV39055.1 hypothetical protein [Lentibacillus sp. JNUCC-1]
MSIEMVVASIEGLTQLHDKLLETSQEKTDALKQDDTERLQSLLGTERKLTRKLEKKEEERQNAVEAWFADHRYEEDSTLTNMLNHLEGSEDQQTVEQAAANLIDKLTALKEQEQLNMALVEQSMQFVQMSLDMMQPSIKNMNYGQQFKTPINDRSVFDSKA